MKADQEQDRADPQHQEVGEAAGLIQTLGRAHDVKRSECHAQESPSIVTVTDEQAIAHKGLIDAGENINQHQAQGQPDPSLSVI